MRKKVLSLCMALALCLSLLPATALAAPPSDQVIYVGNENVTSGGYWTTSEDGQTITSVGDSQPSSGGYIHYDADNNTLTLHNATIKEEVPYNTSTYVAGAAIGVHNQNGAAELTITLEGTNTIAEVGKGIYVLANSTGGATLTITSESGGSLDASASQTGIWVQSNNGNGALFIQNAKVEATGTNTAGYGVNVQSSNSSTAALTVDGGSLTASGSPGILYDSIGSGTVPNTTALTISNSAIVDARNGEIGAGSTTNLQPVSPSGEGIVFNGDEGTVYGNVTLQEDLTIGEDESLTIPDGASLTIGNDATLTNEGTVTNSGTLTNNGTIDNSGTLPDNIDGTAPPSITTTSLAGGTVGTAYTATLAASGTGTITWSNSGDLPAGLTLDGNTGVISGTPTTAGTYSFTVTATNSGGSDSEDFSITINQAQDTTAPTLTAGSAARTGEATATVTFTSSEAGTYYYAVVESGASAPSDLTTSGTSGQCNVGTNTIILTNLTTGAKDIYIVVKDAANNESQPLNMTIPDYVAPSYGISVTPSALNFGSVNAGYTTAPTAQTVTITNTGNQSVTVDLPTSTNYTITAGTGFTSGTATITQNGTAQFIVQPKTGLAAGSYNETLAISGSNNTNASITVSFTVEQRSSGGGPTTYAVTAPDAENGTVRVSPSRASRGTTVTITVTPDEGYELESLTVLDSRDNEIALTDKGDGKYTFTMPSGKVTVEASFAEIAPEPLPFGDVDDGDWFADAVRFVYENGMMNGVSETSFAPHATTSRSMIVTILYRLEGEPVVDYAMDFTDVAGDAYYAEAVRWAASEGIVGGYGGGLFGADDAVTREQLAVILYRYAVYKGYDVSIGEDTNILSYADFADLSEYAIPAMQWACGAGIVNGTSESTLTPQGEATRAQVAAMLMRFVEAIG